jgi:hypothetical protein
VGLKINVEGIFALLCTFCLCGSNRSVVKWSSDFIHSKNLSHHYTDTAAIFFAFSYMGNARLVTDIVIEKGVIVIGNKAFGSSM